MLTVHTACYYVQGRHVGLQELQKYGNDMHIKSMTLQGSSVTGRYVSKKDDEDSNMRKLVARCKENDMGWFLQRQNKGPYHHPSSISAS